MIEINNLSGVPVRKDFLKRVARKVLEDKKTKCQDLSIVLVKPEKIKELNKKYRKKNRPTDVLSFKYNDNSGEIVICPEEVKKNAKKFSSNFKKESAKVLIHGILHLFGLDHEVSKRKAKAMEEKQNYYLSKV